MDVFRSQYAKMNVFAKPMNNVELARTLSWQENALFDEREKND